jgi:hypothetical protein
VGRSAIRTCGDVTVWNQLTRSLKPLADASLSDRARIDRAKRQRQPGGKITNTPEVIEEDVKCRVTVLAVGAEQTLAEQRQALGECDVSFPLGTDIQAGDVLSIEGTDMQGNDWARTLNVIATDAPKSFAVLLTARCIDPAAGGN